MVILRRGQENGQLERAGAANTPALIHNPTARGLKPAIGSTTNQQNNDLTDMPTGSRVGRAHHSVGDPLANQPDATTERQTTSP